MKDPVTGFDYPGIWVARCTSPDDLRLAEKGWGVLTSTGSVLRRGFSTGTTAAAAAKAAVLSLTCDTISVRISLPCGLVADVPAHGHAGTGSSAKYAGDYPADATAGLEFIAEASPAGSGTITVTFGEGIGRFSRDTPRYRKGTPAVSQPALSCIVQSVQEALDETGRSGVTVHITAPCGRDVAKKTLNPRMGIVDGISVLGTTGLVEPWDDHLTGSTMERVAAACRPVLTTGRVGLRFSRLLFPDREVILVGGKLTEALDTARGDIVLCGLPALILRHINPRILEGTGYSTVEELAASPNFPAILAATLREFRTQRPRVTVVLINREGRIIGESP
ncbi:MAG: putative cobalt-precorrin-6A synthase (deacetylating) [Methanoregula sp. PtaU1.Bin006]|uniref:cobalt-precorrin-5B (C(1))-methyltransferase n=1 Tax=Methanoregula sp. PtaU1.Bin006 TaxID=1811681 RepID=UPI0009D01CEE|nr:cobalt-precorrin-5B (C(1))-methyltransferase [Methanoregula sp. PtaU1.Bin006]OPY35218.1 MAG: putative cobalt-precorrin-6A synthase (deacetylating) [Methanoregula sp. PtaU1.Bin006]